MKAISLVVLSLINHKVSCNNEFIPSTESNLFKLEEDSKIINTDQPVEADKESKYFLDDDTFISVPEAKEETPKPVDETQEEPKQEQSTINFAAADLLNIEKQRR